MRYGEIYKIETPKHIYIGQALGVSISRWFCHLKSLKQQKHSNKVLQGNYRKYGITSFKFSIIESGIKEENLSEREIYWTEKLKGINRLPSKYVSFKKKAVIIKELNRKKRENFRSLSKKYGVSLGTLSKIYRQYILSKP